jgi:hypothetical protein
MTTPATAARTPPAFSASSAAPFVLLAAADALVEVPLLEPDEVGVVAVEAGAEAPVLLLLLLLPPTVLAAVEVLANCEA